MLRRTLLALGVAAPALLAACDTVAEIVGVDQFDVDLGNAAVIPIIPATAVQASTNADLDVTLPDVFDVADISIPESGVHFEPATAGRGGGGTCDIRLYVMVDEVPVVQGTVTVDEGAADPVQNVATQYAQPYDRTEICSNLQEPPCPVTNQTLNEDEIRAHVESAVNRGRFDVALVAANDGPCAGALQVETLHFELDVDF